MRLKLERRDSEVKAFKNERGPQTGKLGRRCASLSCIGRGGAEAA